MKKVRNLLRLKLSELDDRLKALKDFRHVLARQLMACDEELEQHGESAYCPVVVISHTRKAPKVARVKERVLST